MPEIETIQKIELSALSWASVAQLPEERRTILLEDKEIADILKPALLTQAPIRILTTSGVWVFGHFLSTKKEADSLSIHLDSGRGKVDVEDEVLVGFELFHEFYVFSAAMIGADSPHFKLSNPTELYRIHWRQLDRSVLREDEMLPVRIREATGRRHARGRIADLSPRGLGVLLDPDPKDGNRRWLGLDQNIIVEPQIPGLSGRDAVPAKVAHWREGEIGEPLRLGISCTIPLALGDQHSLEDFLLERKYPNVKRARTSEDYGEVWRLISLAFQTLTPADVSKKESSIITWKKASWSHVPINRIYLLKSEEQQQGESIGTFSASRYYHRTWLLHQLGVDGSKGLLLSHQLYGRVVDYLRHTDDIKYVMGTFPKDSRVFQKYYIDFIRNDPNAQFHYLEETNILEFDVAQAAAVTSEPNAPSHISLSRFSLKDQSYIFGELKKRFSPMALDALDLREFDPELMDVAAIYHRVALRRNREITVAHVHGRPVGFAIAEWGSDDQNVFSLFDNFRIFCTEVNDKTAEAIKRALLEHVMKAYAKLGVRVAISWTTDTSLASLVAGGKIFHDAYYWIAASNRMGPFLRHLDRIHGRTQAIRHARTTRTT
jgi:hypothetical protein